MANTDLLKKSTWTRKRRNFYNLVKSQTFMNETKIKHPKSIKSQLLSPIQENQKVPSPNPGKSKSPESQSRKIKKSWIPIQENLHLRPFWILQKSLANFITKEQPLQYGAIRHTIFRFFCPLCLTEITSCSLALLPRKKADISGSF